MARVGLLGLGAMGSLMAVNLLQAGHELRVWNRTPGRADSLVRMGAREVATPAAASADAQFVVSMVRDDLASRAVWLGSADAALAAMDPEAMAIECSTVSPDWIRSLAQHASKRGVRLLEAPLAGSRPQAQARKLIFFLGANPTDAAHGESILRALGEVFHRVGPIGAGALTKLTVNALFATQVAVLGELYAALTESSVPLAPILEALCATPVSSPAAMAAMGAMHAGQFAPQFPIELAEKDCRYALSIARTAGVSHLLLEATHAVLRKAITQGFGADHIAGLVQVRP